jgi:hypothetical protein
MKLIVRFHRILMGENTYINLVATSKSCLKGRTGLQGATGVLPCLQRTDTV